MTPGSLWVESSSLASQKLNSSLERRCFCAGEPKTLHMFGQNNHCTVHVKKTGDLEKGETSSFQDLTEKLRSGITEV
jgi:hypothetical protein